jgi:hypothetical protein
MSGAYGALIPYAEFSRVGFVNMLAKCSLRLIMRVRHAGEKRLGRMFLRRILVKLQSAKPTIFVFSPKALPLIVATRAFPKIQSEIQVSNENDYKKDEAETNQEHRCRECFREPRLLRLQGNGNSEKEDEHGNCPSPTSPKLRSRYQVIQLNPAGRVTNKRTGCRRTHGDSSIRRIALARAQPSSSSYRCLKSNPRLATRRIRNE